MNTQNDIIPEILPVGLTLLQSTSPGLRYEVVTALLAAVHHGKGAEKCHALAMVAGDTPRPQLDGIRWENREGILHTHGTELIERYHAEDPECRVVIIEPLLHFDPHAGSETLHRLKGIADSLGIAILIGQQVRRISKEGAWGPLTAKITTDGQQLNLYRPHLIQTIPLTKGTEAE